MTLEKYPYVIIIIPAHNEEASIANVIKKIQDNYIIKNKGAVSIFDNEHLPQELKLKLGMLKLVAVGTVIEGMGYRATEDSYVIV